MASPQPVFMPSPPVGMTRWTAVAREEYAVGAVAVGDQQILPPAPDVDGLERQRHRDGLLEQVDHVGVLLDHAVQREVLGRILHDQEGVAGIRHVIMPALADRDALVEPVAAIEGLAQLEQIALAGEPDAELLAHRARAAVAAGEVARGDVGHAAGARGAWR